MERTGLTFGFVARITSPDRGAGAVDRVLQGHDIGHHGCGWRGVGNEVYDQLTGAVSVSTLELG